MKCFILLTFALFYTYACFADIHIEQAQSVVNKIRSVPSVVVDNPRKCNAKESTPYGCVSLSGIFSFPSSRGQNFLWTSQFEFDRDYDPHRWPTPHIMTPDEICVWLENFWLQNHQEHGSDYWSESVYGSFKTMKDDYKTTLAIYLISHFDVASTSLIYQELRTYLQSLGFIPTDIDSLCNASPSATDRLFTNNL